MVKPRGWGRDEDGRMSRQTDTQMHGEEKSKWALARATCRSHLSGAHLIYRPDPRPSQSRSVRQRQAVRTWGRGAVHVARRMAGGLGLQLPPSPPAGRVQGCACPLLRAKGIHTLSDALCVCVHTCVCSPPRCLRTGHSSSHTWPESLQWDRTRGGPTPEPPAARPPPLIHWGGGQPRVTLSVLTAARGMGKRRPAGPGAAGRGWHTDTEPNALEQWPWFLLQRLPSPDAGGSGKGGPRPCPESSVGRGTQLGHPRLARGLLQGLSPAWKFLPGECRGQVGGKPQRPPSVSDQECPGEPRTWLPPPLGPCLTRNTLQPPGGWPLASAEALPVTLTTGTHGCQPLAGLQEHRQLARGHPASSRHQR